MDEPLPAAHKLSADAAEPRISLHALAGVRAPKFNTIKVRARVGLMDCLALLDSGSTHNFLSETTARQANVALQPCPSLHVTVANGDRVASLGRCPMQRVVIGASAFDVDFYALPLGGYDIVLGAQLLSTLVPKLWDFADQSFWFGTGDARVTWVSINAPTATTSTAALEGAPRELINELLDDFGGLFSDPQGLPPESHLCHRIHLQHGVSAVAVRPYRYAHI